MSTANQNIPLAEKAKEILLLLATEVSREDRKQAVQNLKVSPMTISRYLNGDVRDTGTAEKIINFLRLRVENRKKSFAA
jgi:hypothetical protein